jgi:hypothetical protein
MFISDHDPNFSPSWIQGQKITEITGSRIRIRIKEFKYLKKLFLSSRKYYLKCSSRIRILIFYPSLIPDPGFMGQKGTGSQIRIRNTISAFRPQISNTLSIV